MSLIDRLPFAMSPISSPTKRVEVVALVRDLTCESSSFQFSWEMVKTIYNSIHIDIYSQMNEKGIWKKFLPHVIQNYLSFWSIKIRTIECAFVNWKKTTFSPHFVLGSVHKWYHHFYIYYSPCLAFSHVIITVFKYYENKQKNC